MQRNDGNEKGMAGKTIIVTGASRGKENISN